MNNTELKTVELEVVEDQKLVKPFDAFPAIFGDAIRATLAGERNALSKLDNAKAQAFADSLRDMPLPQFKSSTAFDELPSKIESLAKWVESKITTGELI